MYISKSFSKFTKDDESLDSFTSGSSNFSDAGSSGEKGAKMQPSQLTDNVTGTKTQRKVGSNDAKKADEVKANVTRDVSDGAWDSHLKNQSARINSSQEVPNNSFSLWNYLMALTIALIAALLVTPLVLALFNSTLSASFPSSNHGHDNCVGNAMQLFNISSRSLYIRKARSTLADKMKGDLVVLTFIGFPPEEVLTYQESFKTFKQGLVSCLIQSTAPKPDDVIQAGPAMTSLTLQQQMDSLMKKFPKLIWVENFEVLPGPSLQLLRKYTDEFDPSADKNLVVLSFSVPSSYNIQASNEYEKAAKNYLRDLFSSKLEKVEIDPYLARVANNLFPFVIAQTA